MIKKQDITRLVVEEKKNTFISHLIIFLSWDFTRYYGEIKKDEILLWSSSYWLRLNYPIFVLRFDEENVLKGIRLEKNPFNKIVRKFIPLAIGSFVIFLSVTMEFKAAIVLSIILIIFSLIFYLLINNQLNFEKKNMMAVLKEDLYQIEKELNPSLELKQKSEAKPTKEWTFSKILLRIILYPFCLGLIYISTTQMLPGEKPIYGLVGIGVGLGYLITDLRLSFKKLQPTTYKNNA